jgi:hypothetical protein
MDEKHLKQIADSQEHTTRRPDWWEAARRSRMEKAITERPITITIARGTFYVDLVKPLRGDPYAVYHSAQGIRVHDWRPTNKMVDETTRWKPW